MQPFIHLTVSHLPRSLPSFVPISSTLSSTLPTFGPKDSLICRRTRVILTKPRTSRAQAKYWIQGISTVNVPQSSALDENNKVVSEQAYIREIITPYLPNKPQPSLLSTYLPSIVKSFVSGEETDPPNFIEILRSSGFTSKMGLWRHPASTLVVRPVPLAPTEHTLGPSNCVFYTPTPNNPLPTTPETHPVTFTSSPSPNPPLFISDHSPSSYLTSSVPDLQNVNVSGGGKKDPRILNGDCWSEFRVGYVGDSIRRMVGGNTKETKGNRVVNVKDVSLRE